MTKMVRFCGVCLTVFGLVFIAGCKNEKVQPKAAESKVGPNLDSIAISEQKRLAAVQDMATQQKALDERVETTKQKVAKLGNKTRKKLKSKLDSIETANREVKDGATKLNQLRDPNFTEELGKVKATIASTTKNLDEVKKFLK